MIKNRDSSSISFTVIGTIAIIIAGAFFSIGFIAVPVNNVQRIEYICQCGQKIPSDPFFTYNDCNDCKYRTWWPRIHAVGICTEGAKP